MKKLIFLASLAALAISCTKETDAPEGYIARTYTASFDDSTTKTALGEGGSVTWKVGDKVLYYSKANGQTGTTTVAEDCAKAELSMDIASDASFLVAVHGGTALSANTGTALTIEGAVPSVQSGVFGDHHVSLVKTGNLTAGTLSFKNITSCLKFTISRSDVAKVVIMATDGTKLNGGGIINVSFEGESTSCSFGEAGGSSITVNNGGAGTFYIATLPCTLAKGFTISCYDAGGGYLGRAKNTKSVTIQKNSILNLGVLDRHIETQYKDLSENGTANCYIVSEPGSYKFNASVKGSSSEAIEGTPYNAEVLWESFGTDTAPATGEIVSEVIYTWDGCIRFSSGKNGNAVIALKDRDGKILWSWHIWVCEGYDPSATDQVYNNGAGTMMDRNLGATSATPGDVKALGLLYQWGRKDPFPGGRKISYPSYGNQSTAASTITWPSAVASNASTGSIAYATANPTQFISGNTSNYDWCYTGSSSADDSRWQTVDKEKGLYDPCPAGYRVPNGGSNGVWSKALGTQYDWKTSTNWDNTDMGMNFGATDKKLGPDSVIWYPAAGHLSYLNGWLYNVGDCGTCWSCSLCGNHAYNLLIDNSGNVNASAGHYRADGLSVRCLKEGSVQPDGPATDLCADGTANCYIVSSEGKYKFSTVKGNSLESVGDVASAAVLWESYGTAQAPSIGDLVTGISYSEGHIIFVASNKKGNAVIAARDAERNILWSWHIWLTDKPEDQIYNNNAGTMMDRNLGATSASPGDAQALGLFYQWGRKDPFLGSSGISGSQVAKSSKSWPSPEKPSDHLSDNITLAYATANPMVFLKNDTSPYNWYCVSHNFKDDKLWYPTKTVYDPCPPGYRVPDGNDGGVWSKAFNTSQDIPYTWDSSNKGMNFGANQPKLGRDATIWYPAAGELRIIDGQLASVGSMGCYWSCGSNSSYGYCCCISNDGIVIPTMLSYRADGMSVRCLKE